MKTKQIYIDLLEKALLKEDNFDLGEFEGHFLIGINYLTTLILKY